MSTRPFPTSVSLRTLAGAVTRTVAVTLAVLLGALPAAAEQQGEASQIDSLINQLIRDDEAGPAPAEPDGSAARPGAQPPRPVVRPGEANGQNTTDGFAFDAGVAQEPRPVRVAQADPVGSTRRAARDTGDDLDTILDRRTLRVGTVLFAPYAMRDAAGTLIGHEIDIALALGGDLGVEVEIVPLSEEELVGALERRSIDVIIAAYAVTPTRAVQVTFTRPYAKRFVHLIAATSGAPRGRDLRDFDRDGVRIAVARGAPGERIAVERLPKAELIRFPEVQSAKTALLDDQITLLLATSPFPEVLVAQSPERFRLPLEEPLAETALAFGIRGGNPDLLAFLDAWILARTMDRFLDKTRAYWFDSTDWLPRLTDSPRIDRIDATVR
ncbi:MAG: transporter substrate-binding domain-containing protein [Alphaproteobacteria bacterium]